ncbi:MAG: ribosome maturation factor RimP [Candidatus Nanopelagicales bacterium]
MPAKQALERLVEPAVQASGSYLEAITVRSAGKRRVVRVVVDHPGGLPLDLLAEISRAVGRALDDSNAMGESPYVLEVTSPGVDRPLTQPRHWLGNVGRLVEITTTDGQVTLARITGADHDGADLGLAGHARRLEYAQITKAVVQVEFHRIDEVDLGEDSEASEDE